MNNLTKIYVPKIASVEVVQVTTGNVVLVAEMTGGALAEGDQAKNGVVLIVPGVPVGIAVKLGQYILIDGPRIKVMDAREFEQEWRPQTRTPSEEGTAWR